MAWEPAIEVKALEKVYRGSGKSEPTRALKSIDLSIPRGSIFGLLGPNGAGKSTFINILAGLVKKTSGRARVWGFDIDEHPRNARNSIGVVPQELFFDAFLRLSRFWNCRPGCTASRKGREKPGKFCA